LSEEERIVADKPREKGEMRAQYALIILSDAHMIINRILRDLPMMAKRGKLNVWCKEVVRLWACQCYHLLELLINWEVTHVLEPNATNLPVVSRNGGLNHSQEYKLVVIFTADSPTGKLDPH
jgi:hypothetical protein